MPESLPPRASIVAIGAELLAGALVDTNSAWLSTQLEALGFDVVGHRTCGDQLPRIQTSVAQACAEAEVVILTGGLGPTSDDLTVSALAEALGSPLEFHPPTWAAIEERFAAFGRTPNAQNRRQAELPRGATVLPNEVGTAPGLRVELHGARVYSLPGVPREMRWLWAKWIEAELRELAPGATEEWIFRTVGLSESVLGERMAPVEALPGLVVRYNVEEALGTIVVSLRARDAAVVREAERLSRVAAGDYLCAEGDQTLAEALVADLARRGLTVATAESCTGGRVAAALTGVPGSSAVLLEGVVAYANVAKERLGVDPALLAAHGAVSPQVARALAHTVQARAGTSLAVGVTGIAGPGGGSDEKPVGRVYFHAVGPEAELPLERTFGGERSLVQSRATAVALDLLRRVSMER
ncbi:MAG: CinA family nicotinamide mononucleotide deamidase-related protein [Planctomycetes bacterium]|nr:CinA family nicotinamide mononucleotide deamidase-related protein [Planctomycetota bacterium]